MPIEENHDVDNYCLVGLVEDEHHDKEDKWDGEHATRSGK
jgi:hypothetical protein